MELWNNNTEKQFFLNALGRFAAPKKLFYNLNTGKFAYVPKDCNERGKTLQSRNSLIGAYTETWARNIFSPIAEKFNLYALNSVECLELGLTNKSTADLAFCTTDSKRQKAKNIKLLFEIKMSIVSNYQYHKSGKLEYCGDYKTHKGNPSLLRSDSMLKAMGKSINIRVSGLESTRIPIIILGNSPITNSYIQKVDYLKKYGVIQGFWSLNPSPTKSSFIKETEGFGFKTIKDINNLESLVNDVLNTEINYFSSTASNTKLGEFIRIAYQEPTDELRAAKFLSLIREM